MCKYINMYLYVKQIRLLRKLVCVCIQFITAIIVQEKSDNVNTNTFQIYF